MFAYTLCVFCVEVLFVLRVLKYSVYRMHYRSVVIGSGFRLQSLPTHNNSIHVGNMCGRVSLKRLTDTTIPQPKDLELNTKGMSIPYRVTLGQ